MPKGYERMKDAFKREGMGDKVAKAKAGGADMECEAQGESGNAEEG